MAVNKSEEPVGSLHKLNLTRAGDNEPKHADRTNPDACVHSLESAAELIKFSTSLTKPNKHELQPPEMDNENETDEPSHKLVGILVDNNCFDAAPTDVAAASVSICATVMYEELESALFVAIAVRVSNHVNLPPGA